MAARTPSSTSLRSWKCAQCRYFSSSRPRAAVGPEHPRYIEVPEPPQQTAPYRPFIKGQLPVPRDIFAYSKGVDRADDAEVAKATTSPSKQIKHPRGSRDAWKQKLSASRRENLREGIQDLRARKTRTDMILAQRVARKQAERQELMSRPEREDERLTTPSTGLDVQKLLHGGLEDPTRDVRLAHKARNLAIHTSAKRANRLDSLHTLYMNARNFIVTPEQLDDAIDTEFGTPDAPRQFGMGVPVGRTPGITFDEAGRWSSEVTSMWAYGKPASVQDMLDRANRKSGPRMGAMDRAEGKETLVEGRVRRVAERLTGGKMEE